MANIKSQKKRIITNEKARMRNRAYRSKLKTAIRATREAVEAGNGEQAFALAQKACRLLDVCASKGIIHKNQAANRKSKLMKLVNTVATDEDRAAYKPTKQINEPKGGTKKAARKAERQAAMKAAEEEKAKRREAQLKQEKKAADKKAKEEAEAAAAAAEEETAEGDAPAEEAAE